MVIERITHNQVGVYNPFGFRPKEIIPLLVGAALSVGSSVIGGIKSAQKNKEAQAEAKAQNARNNAWYTRRYNEDYLDTAAGQNLIRQAKDYANANWKKQQGAQAVGGGTDAATAMAKEAGNKMMGDTIANIASADVQRKQNVDNIHNQQQNQYSQQVQQYKTNEANNIANVASQTSDALMSAGVAAEGVSGTSAKANAAKSAGNYTGANSLGTTLQEEADSRLNNALNNGYVKHTW